LVFCFYIRFGTSGVTFCFLRPSPKIAKNYFEDFNTSFVDQKA